MSEDLDPKDEVVRPEDAKAGVHAKAAAPVEQAAGEPPVASDGPDGDVVTSETATPDLPEAAEPLDLPDNPLLAGIAGQFPAVVVEERPGQDVLRVPVDQWLEVATACKAAGYEMFTDLTAVDYLRRNPRFEVVAVLVSVEHVHRVRLLTGVPASNPVVASISSVYPGANFYEREAFDMFGIVFSGHPDLTRILMPDEWEGYPLRKDFSVGSVPVQFKESHKAT
ncbi:MAG: NADH-quinone oxidoreductase subunit C [Acidimicrobiia bacterium]|nr:NADH-quinone oxidoreductase subunit C [Acidimicrobiia bacterium]NNF65561.1 NADH-quinone oxidoreductase subunit C [Acidimicrobiia bacterium]